MPPLSSERLVRVGAGLLAGSVLLLLCLIIASSGGAVVVVLGWLVETARALGVLLLASGLVLRELTRRGVLPAPPPCAEPTVDWYR